MYCTLQIDYYYDKWYKEREDNRWKLFANNLWLIISLQVTKNNSGICWLNERFSKEI